MKRKELFGQIAMIAVFMVGIAWVSYAWTASTGLTWATRSSRGRIASPEDVEHSQNRAILVTVFAGPIALVAELMRRRK